MKLKLSIFVILLFVVGCGINHEPFDPTETGALSYTEAVIDDKLGAIPAGGTTGQVIAKSSATDYDTEWSDVSTEAATGDSATAFFDAGTIEHERGGLEADVSAYSGLVKVTGGATSAVTVTAFGESILDDADEATFKATVNLEIGTDVLAPTGDGSGLTAVDAATGDTATAFFDAGQIEAARGGTGIDSSASTGIPFVTAGTWAILKGTHEAAADPAVGDDSADGYVVGSRWVNTTDDKEFICLDNTLGAAVWTETTGAGAGSGDITAVLGDTTGDVPVLFQTAGTFADGDTTPDVSTKSIWKTGNTGATSIAGFDAGAGAIPDEQLIFVRVNDALTTFDFTASNLFHPYATDYAASAGDVLMFQYDADNTIWRSVGLGGAGAEQIIAELNANGTTALSEDILPDTSATTDGVVPTTAAITDDWVLTKQSDGSAAWAAVGSGSDSTAIHDNVSGEIVAITEKTYTASADLVLIEDSEASNAKKKVQMSNMHKTSGMGDTIPIYDTDAATKKIQFDASAVTAGQTRMMNAIDAAMRIPAATLIATTGALAAETVDSDQYVDGSIDAVHLAADVIDESKIADDGIDSEHYNDGSIDSAHLASTAVYTATASKAAAYTAGTDDAKEVYGGVIYVTGAATITLPAIAAGMSVSVVTIGAVAVSVDTNASDRMYLDGTALGDGDKATNTSTTGDMLVCTYESAAGWYCASGSPDGDHWTDGGP